MDVICPGFVADCLETLEEIAMECRAALSPPAARPFNYIPCLNERPDWIRALADIALANLQGWLCDDPSQLTQAADLSRTRALGLGTKS